MRYILEDKITGTLSIHQEWDEAWTYAKTVVCKGSRVEGNVLLHETSPYDPSTFYSEYDPGVRQSDANQQRIRHLLLAQERVAVTQSKEPPPMIPAYITIIDAQGKVLFNEVRTAQHISCAAFWVKNNLANYPTAVRVVVDYALPLPSSV